MAECPRGLPCIGMHKRSARKTKRERGNGDAKGCAAAGKRQRRCTTLLRSRRDSLAALTKTSDAHQSEASKQPSQQRGTVPSQRNRAFADQCAGAECA